MPPTSVTPTTKSIRVMIVDDSALMRKLLTQLLSRNSEIEIVDTAMDGQFALDHLRRVRPDVILMDVEMPRLDGLTALDRIVADYGLPVVMCSAHTSAGAKSTIDALARGAVDFIEKPSLAALTSGAAASEIISRVRGAAGARVTVRHRPPPVSTGAPPPPAPPAASLSTRSVIEQIRSSANRTQPEIIAIGTSTGGPPALEQVLAVLPDNFPLGIVIVQHMPPGFTSLLAEHLNRNTRIEVREAVDGEPIRPGLALIAPGGAHLKVLRAGAQYVASVDTNGPLVSGHRPSVDVLFDSLVAASRGRVASVLMTGMGSDGAAGLGRLAEAGAVTIAQSPESCVCFGMPKSAIDRGYARAVLPLEDIGSAIAACGSGGHSKPS
ncbi:MAG TPA: chemotaxis response regulator protein-glutamate methylesterase [Blastocatellia bacterium]|nr:chemotaxis response regulator protein-glutamate methylesterase [Blastocatellia bacterium]